MSSPQLDPPPRSIIPLKFLLISLLLCWCPLTCNAEIVHCSVVEEQPRGTPVCDLASLISGYGTGSSASNRLATASPLPPRYQLIERNPPGEAHGMFELHQTSGLLSLATPVDREAIRSCRDNPNRPCRLDFSATYLPDASDPGGMRLLDIYVTVEDINDNPPRFAIGSSIIRVKIREHDRSARIQLPRADDPDFGRNGSVTYGFPESLRYSRLYSKFSVVEGDGGGGVGGVGGGGPELRIVGDIDLEGDERGLNGIKLIAQALDDGTPQLGTNLTVLVEIENTNDFEPVFESGGRSLLVTIPENTTVNSVVFTARAADRDEPVGSPSRLMYSLRRGADVASSRGGVVGGVGGGGVGGNPLPPFRIDPRSGEVRLVGSLDAEDRQAFSLEVLAMDGHRPEPRTATMTVSIRVEDVNDNAPEILISPISAKCGLSVQENQPATMLAIVDVIDRDVDERNRRLDCDIAEFNRAQENFILLSEASFTNGFGGVGRLEDPGRRRYILKNSRPLDREQMPEYNLRLTCHDSAGLSTMRQFRILVCDVNDSPPRFPSSTLNLRVPENRPPGTVVGLVLSRDADEGDNARTLYQVSESCSAYLGIGQRNGTLYTRVAFDRELNSSVGCTVAAHDAQRPELTDAVSFRVSIDDENDCAPVFLSGVSGGNFTFRVPENSPPGYSIGHLTAKDDDEGENGRVSFVLTRPSQLFRVKPDGVIELLGVNTQLLDRETSGRHQLLVRAFDHGLPQKSTDALVTILVLDENDNSPRFLFPSSRNSTLNVSVHESPGTVVAVISAEDADEGDNGRLMYSLVTGAVDDNTGLPACQPDLFRLSPAESDQLVLASSPPTSLADRFTCRLTISATDTDPVVASRRTSRQGLTVRFTGDKPRDDSGDSSGRPGGNSGVGRDGGSGARDLVVVTVCVALSFLVLLCVVLLLAYFCYYLQMPGVRSADSTTTATMDGVAGVAGVPGLATPGSGRKGRIGWLEKFGFQRSSSGSRGSRVVLGLDPNGLNSELSTAGDRAFISLPMQRSDGYFKSAELCEDDDDFSTAGPQYFVNRHPPQQSSYYQRPQSRFGNTMQFNQRRRSDDSESAAAFLQAGVGDRVEAAKSTDATRVDSYYKSLRPPSTDPTRRRCTQQQQQQQLLLEDLPTGRPKFPTVRYLVDPSLAGNRTAEGRSGFVYGSPYLTSSFV